MENEKVFAMLLRAERVKMIFFLFRDTGKIILKGIERGDRSGIKGC